VSDLPLAVQARLAAEIEDAPAEALPRLVAATCSAPEEAFDSGRLRADLYYTLRGVSLALPPLRRRSGDLRVLVPHLARRLRLGELNVSGADWQRLESHDWPGNVRELQRALERLATLGPESLELAPRRPEVSMRLPPEGIVLEQLERELTLQALETADWNQARAGRLLGLNRDQVRYRILKFGLERPGSNGHGCEPSS
jgi:two-component system, NtrC family, response regulator AtoC